MAYNKLSDYLNPQSFADAALVSTSISDFQTVVNADIDSLKTNVMLTPEALATDYVSDGTTGLLESAVEGSKTTNAITYDSNDRITGYTEIITADDGSVMSQSVTISYDSLGEAVLNINT